MELREWLIILGLVLVTIIVVDGVRRLQRQRRVPRLDQAVDDDGSAATDPEEAARQAEINWELPNGGARVVRPATQTAIEPKPKLQRQEHPGPSKVFSHMSQTQDAAMPERKIGGASNREDESPRPVAEPIRAERDAVDGSPAWSPQPERGDEATPLRREEPFSARSLSEEDDAPRPAHADHTHEGHEEDDIDEAPRSRFSRGGMAAALRSGGQRMSQSMQRMSSAFQRQSEEDAHPHREPSLDGAPDLSASDTAANGREARQERGGVAAFEPPFEPVGVTAHAASDTPTADELAPAHDGVADDKVTAHPVVEKARRHHVSAQRARETLAHAEEVIVISVMARNEEGFSGPQLLNLMLACGLRYSEMGIFLRYETEDAQSDLQFAMVDVVKPGTFDLEAMDDFATPGVTFLMPLPGAQDSAAAFEAMVETAMVLVRNLGGELKDENRSVMTAQTVGFARQRVQEFERRHRLHRYQAT